LMSEPILSIDSIKVRYSGLPVIHGISLGVNAGETVCVVGSNGAGKSTLLRAIMGSQPVFEGRILFRGQEIQKLRTEQIVRLGIIYVPEEKMLFRPISVEENLLLGAYILEDESQIKKNLEFVYTLFAPLRSRRLQAASTLSGGEQQMVAIGRGLMSNPSILMLDEPSLGLAPILVDEVLDTVRRLKEQGSRTCERPWTWLTGVMCSRQGGWSRREPGTNCWKATCSARPSWGFDQTENIRACHTMRAIDH
jgi:branched-chain amino acid transport system ATP-binding protein